MDVKIGEILRHVHGEAMAPLIESVPVNRVSTDTRLLEKKDIFFALTGPRFDGHDFIAEALEKGARHFVVSDRKKVNPSWFKQANFIAVGNTTTAYGDLAAAWRQKFRIPAVAITGSTGKTTVKELLAHLLASKYKVLKNRGTENNLIGVPKTLLQLEPEHQVIVLEMGTNAPGEIARLSSIIRPQAAVLTRIGYSHLEGLSDLAGVREEKLKVLDHLDRGGLLLVNGEDPVLAAVQSGVHRILRAGLERGKNEISAERVSGSTEGTVFYWNGLKMQTQLVGRHNVINCLLAVGTASALDVPAEAIQKALETFKPVPGRLGLKTVSDITFLDDSYNSNPTSFAAALETLSSLRVNGRKGIVCGDMLELGNQAETLHREIGSQIAGLGIDYLVTSGKLCRHLTDEAVKKGFPKDQVFNAKDSAEAGTLCRRVASAGDLILVKGSRGMQMEKIFECFSSSYTR